MEREDQSHRVPADVPEGDDEAIDRLLIEPVVAARYIPENARTLLDAGSGGGSPAIPLKLASRNLALRMVEVKTRKAVFLREAVRALGLRDAEVETSRFEELLPRAELHEALDLVSIRAVRIETRTLNTLQAFLRPGGKLLLFRGASKSDLEDSPPPPLAWMATYPLVDSLHSQAGRSEQDPSLTRQCECSTWNNQPCSGVKECARSVTRCSRRVNIRLINRITR